jgi:hypothetical protein
MTDPLTVAANIATIVQGMTQLLGCLIKCGLHQREKSKLESWRHKLKNKNRASKILESQNAKFIEHHNESHYPEQWIISVSRVGNATLFTIGEGANT